jgi:phage shock protein PspC (stress-responsive transcriptional regulator)
MPATRSILLRRDGGWRIVILDRAAYLGSPDCSERRTPPDHARLSLQPGGERHLSFLALQAAEDWEVGAALSNGGAQTAPESRLVERRGMTLRMVRADEGTDRLEALLDTPEPLRIAAAAGDAASSGGGSLISFDAGLDPAVRGDLAGARLRIAGDRLARQFVQRLDLSRGSAALVGRARQAIGNGSSFTLGRTDEARLSFHRLDLDWQPLQGVLLLGVAGIAGGLAATFGWRTQSRYAFIVLALVDFLLVFRLLAGIEAAVIDPRPTIVAGVAQSILAIAVVPYLLAAFAPAPVKEAAGRLPVVAHSLLVVGILVHLVLFNGLPFFSQTAGLLMGAALVAFAARMSPARGAKYAQHGLAGAGRVARFVTAVADWLAPRARSVAAWIAVSVRRSGRLAKPAAAKPENRLAPVMAEAAEPDGAAQFARALWIMLACSLLLSVRVLLPERILILTAAVYMPLCIAYGAFSFHQGARALSEGAGSAWQWLAWSVLLVLPALYPAAAMAVGGGDPGFTIVSLWGIMLFGALLRLWVPPGAKKSARWKRFLPLAPFGIAACAMFFIAVMPVPLAASNWPDPTDESESAKQERSAQVRDSLNRQRYQQRFLAWIAPERFADAGTREAQELRVALRHMAAYSNQGHFGRGFLNQPEPTELRRYQLTDNGAAIHLLAPFGRVGTAMFLLVLGIAAAGATRRLCRTTAGMVMGFPGLLALFSLWTLFSTGTYMVLANMQVVPFTGRNIYLLAANSPSDLIEAFALLAMALCGLVRSSP